MTRLMTRRPFGSMLGCNFLPMCIRDKRNMEETLVKSSLTLGEVMQASVQNAPAFLYFRSTMQLDFH